MRYVHAYAVQGSLTPTVPFSCVLLPCSCFSVASVLREDLRLCTTAQSMTELGEAMLPMTLADASEEQDNINITTPKNVNGVCCF